MLIVAIASASFFASTSVSASTEYPSSPVTIVAPYGAGGASDLVARSLAETARTYMNEKPVIVVNKTGNGGMNGARYVSGSTADGYTLLLARPGMALYPAINKKSKLNWDSYTFIGPLEVTPMILAVNAKSPYQNVDNLIDAINEKPGRLTYAASGPTSLDGFTVQSLMSDADLDPQSAVTLVPYRGGAALATALMGNHVDFLAIAAGSLMPHIQAGKLRPLAVFAPERMAALPEVPTMAELGYKQAAQITGWSALYGPKDLPENVVNKWQDVLKKVATDPTWLDLAQKRGSISTSGQFDQEEFSKAQYSLFRHFAVEFGYLK